MNFKAEDHKHMNPAYQKPAGIQLLLIYNHMTHDSINKHVTLQLQSL